MTDITYTMRGNSVRRIIAVLLLVGMNAGGIAAVGETFSYYNDTESSGGVFASAELDIALTPSPADGWTDVGGNVFTRTITVGDAPGFSSIPLLYTVHVDHISGNACADAGIKVEFDTQTLYDGLLSGLVTSPVPATGEDTYGQWTYTLTLASSVPMGQSCSFDIIYDAWQKEMPSYGSGGYTDTETVGNTVHESSQSLTPQEGKILIAKIYFKGNSADEWVEIHNGTGSIVDVSGWHILDGNSSDTLPAGSFIPAGEFGLVVGNNANVLKDWFVPDTVHVIALDNSSLGSGLNDTGDMLVLTDTEGVSIDQLNWGPIDSNWHNYTAYQDGIFNPSVTLTGVDTGVMLSRTPDTISPAFTYTDHDTATDWQYVKRPVIESFAYESDKADPNDDLSKEGDNGEQEVWYSGKPNGYDVNWVVSNPNSGMGNPFTALYLIKDTNDMGGNGGKIDAGDTSTVVSTSTDFTGTWTFIDSGGFLGYVWMRLVTILPMNPMANIYRESGKIYDPDYCTTFPEGCTATEPILITDEEPLVEGFDVAEPLILQDITYIGNETPDLGGANADAPEDAPDSTSDTGSDTPQDVAMGETSAIKKEETPATVAEPTQEIVASELAPEMSEEPVFKPVEEIAEIQEPVETAPAQEEHIEAPAPNPEPAALPDDNGGATA